MLSDLIKKQNVDRTLENKRWDKALPLLEKQKDILYKVDKIDIALADSRQGDFLGLLQSLNIPDHLQYVHMRINGFLSSVDYDGTVTDLYTIPQEYLEEFYSEYIRKKIVVES